MRRDIIFFYYIKLVLRVWETKQGEKIIKRIYVSYDLQSVMFNYQSIMTFNL